MMNDPHLEATSMLGNKLRGLSIEQIMGELPEENLEMLGENHEPLQEEQEDPINEKIAEFISKLM